MEQAFNAHKSKKKPDGRFLIEEDGHTWADVQAALHQSSTPLSVKISKLTSNIVGIQISDQVDSVEGSSTQVAVAWSCVSMVLNVAAVSSTPCCK